MYARRSSRGKISWRKRACEIHSLVHEKGEESAEERSVNSHSLDVDSIRPDKKGRNGSTYSGRLNGAKEALALKSEPNPHPLGLPRRPSIVQRSTRHFCHNHPLPPARAFLPPPFHVQQTNNDQRLTKPTNELSFARRLNSSRKIPRNEGGEGKRARRGRRSKGGAGGR